MNIDGKLVRFSTSDIASRHGNKISLMPAGLYAVMSPQEFPDLIEYLASLKQPASAISSNRGMPANVPEIPKPVVVQPFIGEGLRFPHSVVENGQGVRSGLTWFGQLPGVSNTFLVVHETGKIWLLEKNGTNETKTLFVDLSKEIFSERGPNGLLSIAFHPNFRQNHKYYLNYQILENDNIVSTVMEREVSADFRMDAGKPSRLVWKSGTSTQNHTGGGIAFGPDGYLYIGMGDTGPQGDPEGHGQNLTLLLGKMLRIDVDHQDAGLGYAIPKDNPFRGLPNARPEIWAYGLREPWRFSFDSATGRFMESATWDKIALKKWISFAAEKITAGMFTKDSSLSPMTTGRKARATCRRSSLTTEDTDFAWSVGSLIAVTNPHRFMASISSPIILPSASSR